MKVEGCKEGGQQRFLACAVSVPLSFTNAFNPLRALTPSADALRDEGGFRREYDGHVWVQARNGGWMEVRLDAKLPGTVLLRDEATGAVFYITNNNIQQVGDACTGDVISISSGILTRDWVRVGRTGEIGARRKGVDGGIMTGGCSGVLVRRARVASCTSGVGNL